MMPPKPAAFGRLCVETSKIRTMSGVIEPAAFGRLCVETNDIKPQAAFDDPAAFGRLCVETIFGIDGTSFLDASRLRAAVC